MEELGDWQRTHYSSERKPEQDSDTVIVMGWVRAIRLVGKLIFFQLADRDGFVQVTIRPKDVPENLIKKLENISRETVLAVKGTVKANKEAPHGFEIIPREARIL
ncbi:MAG: OB-fold nucleic acid binding domain-containing protein, partial [Candidatus Aenigmatarchaeota archaeon]